jgi:hypothetical protein
VASISAVCLAKRGAASQLAWSFVMNLKIFMLGNIQVLSAQR